MTIAVLVWLFQGCVQKNQDTTGTEDQDMIITRISDYSVNIDYVPVEDSAITNAVKDEIFIQKGVDNTHLNISTMDGIVKLEGEVNNILERDRAANIAQAIKGVRGVINEISVVSKEISDADILVLLRQALVRNPTTEKIDITPSVVDGKVILNGSVESWQEKRIAGYVAKGVSGVQSFENNLIVDQESFRPDSEIETDVSSMLEWDTRVDNEMIDVNVEDATVYLSGIVGSVAEKTHAKNLAMMSGAKDVVHHELIVERWARDTEMRKSKYIYRSDNAIKEAINDVLLYDPRVNRFQINVGVEDGSVTLVGVVTNMNAKDVAEQNAKNIVGVWNVNNRIEVKPPEMIEDSIAERNVEVTISSDPYLEKYEITANVTDGKLLLTGLVDNSFEKNRAEQISSYVKGITDIDNELAIDGENYMPYVYDYSFHTYYPQDKVETEFENIKTDNEILSNTEEQIFWSPFVNEEEVDVSVDQGIVTLSGTVQTPRERIHAEKNAYEAGAITVENEITVAYGPNPAN